jgi:hypothetical protein
MQDTETRYCEACERPLNTIRKDDPDPRRRVWCWRCVELDKENDGR